MGPIATAVYKGSNARLSKTQVLEGLEIPTFVTYNPILEVGVIVVRGPGGAPADAGGPLWGNAAVTAEAGASNRSTIVLIASVWLNWDFKALLYERAAYMLLESGAELHIVKLQSDDFENSSYACCKKYSKTKFKAKVAFWSPTPSFEPHQRCTDVLQVRSTSAEKASAFANLKFLVPFLSTNRISREWRALQTQGQCSQHLTKFCCVRINQQGMSAAKRTTNEERRPTPVQ